VFFFLKENNWLYCIDSSSSGWVTIFHFHFSSSSYFSFFATAAPDATSRSAVPIGPLFQIALALSSWPQGFVMDGVRRAILKTEAAAAAFFSAPHIQQSIFSCAAVC